MKALICSVKNGKETKCVKMSLPPKQFLEHQVQFPACQILKTFPNEKYMQKRKEKRHLPSIFLGFCAIITCQQQIPHTKTTVSYMLSCGPHHTRTLWKNIQKASINIIKRTPKADQHLPYRYEHQGLMPTIYLFIAKSQIVSNEYPPGTSFKPLMVQDDLQNIDLEECLPFILKTLSQ